MNNSTHNSNSAGNAAPAHPPSSTPTVTGDALINGSSALFPAVIPCASDSRCGHADDAVSCTLCPSCRVTSWHRAKCGLPTCWMCSGFACPSCAYVVGKGKSKHGKLYPRIFCFTCERFLPNNRTCPSTVIRIAHVSREVLALIVQSIVRVFRRLQPDGTLAEEPPATSRDIIYDGTSFRCDTIPANAIMNIQACKCKGKRSHKFQSIAGETAHEAPPPAEAGGEKGVEGAGGDAGGGAESTDTPSPSRQQTHVYATRRKRPHTQHHGRQQRQTEQEEEEAPFLNWRSRKKRRKRSSMPSQPLPTPTPEAREYNASVPTPSTRHKRRSQVNNVLSYARPQQKKQPQRHAISPTAAEVTATATSGEDGKRMPFHASNTHLVNFDPDNSIPLELLVQVDNDIPPDALEGNVNVWMVSDAAVWYGDKDEEPQQVRVLLEINFIKRGSIHCAIPGIQEPSAIVGQAQEKIQRLCFCVIIELVDCPISVHPLQSAFSLPSIAFRLDNTVEYVWYSSRRVEHAEQQPHAYAQTSRSSQHAQLLVSKTASESSQSNDDDQVATPTTSQHGESSNPVEEGVSPSTPPSSSANLAIAAQLLRMNFASGQDS